MIYINKAPIFTNYIPSRDITVQKYKKKKTQQTSEKII